MDFVAELERISKLYEQMVEKAQQLEREREGLLDECKRLQGEYRVILRLGQEQGVLDEAGNPVAQREDQENVEPQK